MRLILASTSPQRKKLLAGLSVPFTVIAPNVDEDGHLEADPIVRARELARLKAESVHATHTDAVVIGCDTLVVTSDGSLLEKPKNVEEAREMLRLQSGTVSIVHSALAVIGVDGSIHEGVSSSSVTFKTLTEAEVEWWIASGLWQGRSGAFQIDGPGQLMIERIEGDWTGIVGLPVFLLGELLAKTNHSGTVFGI